MPALNSGNSGNSGNAIDEVIGRAPDDSLQTRLIKRQGWTLHVAIAVSGVIAAAVIGMVLHLQGRESAECADQIQELRSDFDDRLAHHSSEVDLCRSQSEALRLDLRALERDFRDKLGELNERLHAATD